MTIDLEQRYLRRYAAAGEILKNAEDRVKKTTSEKPEVIDLSNRLILIPTFVWENLFQRGLDEKVFWDKSLEAFGLVASEQYLLQYLQILRNKCSPQYRTRSEIGLAGVSVQGQPHYKFVFGHLGPRAEEALQNVQFSSSDLVLSFLSTEEIPLARYRLDFLKGKAKFPFDNLIDGGVRYFLPTQLDSVQLCLSYPRRIQYPYPTVIVNPITDSKKTRVI